MQSFLIEPESDVFETEFYEEVLNCQLEVLELWPLSRYFIKLEKSNMSDLLLNE